VRWYLDNESWWRPLMAIGGGDRWLDEGVTLTPCRSSTF
jgi:hypothetical protein